MKRLSVLLLSVMIVGVLNGCTSGDIVTQNIERQIDSTSQQLKDSLRQADVGKQVDELNRSVRDTGARISNDPDLRNLGHQARSTLEQMKGALDGWLNQSGKKTPD